MIDHASEQVRAAAVPFANQAPVGGPKPAVLPYATAVVVAVPACDADTHDCAVASFLCGLLFFLAPFVTGIMSVIFGIAVLRHGRRLPLGDLVAASVGTLLGLANLGFWTVLILP